MIFDTEFKRADTEFKMEGRRIFDALTIFHDREPRDLSAAHRFYCGKPFENAHSALDDVRATINVMRGQFKKYPDLPTNPDDLHAACNKPRHPNAIDREAKLIMKNGEPTLNFGQKYPGISLHEIAEIDPGFLDWMVSRGDFSAEVKTIVADVLCNLVHPDAIRKHLRRRTVDISNPPTLKEN